MKTISITPLDLLCLPTLLKKMRSCLQVMVIQFYRNGSNPFCAKGSIIRTNKIIILLVLVLTAAVPSYAQTFEKGEVLVSPGIGLGLYGVGYGVGFAVPLTLNVDVGVSNYVSAGGYVGHWSKTWDYSLSGQYKFSSTHIGARGTFHWGKYFTETLEIDIIPENMDLYVTGWMGYNSRSAKWVSNSSNPLTDNISWGNRFQTGAQIGARYFPKENFGFFGEWGGTPTAYSNWGITLKF